MPSIFQDLSAEAMTVDSFERPPFFSGIKTNPLWLAIAAHNAGSSDAFVWRLLFVAMGVPEDLMEP